nr:DUF680 domain-containing protein [Mesorhizobium soli]
MGCSPGGLPCPDPAADHDPAPANASQSVAARVDDSTVTASIKKSDVAVQTLEARGSNRNLFGR